MKDGQWDGRESRNERGCRDSRDSRDGRDNRDNRDSGDGGDGRDSRDGRDIYYHYDDTLFLCGPFRPLRLFRLFFKLKGER